MSASYEPSHTLSAKSKELGRDLFVWSLDGAKPSLHSGLHIYAYNEVTFSKLYRWIGLVLLDDQEGPAKTSFELYHAKVEHVIGTGLLYSYDITANGHVILTDSNELIQPNELGICAPDAGSPDTFVRFALDEISFFEIEKSSILAGQDPIKYSVGNDEFIARVVQRDSGRCVITAAETPVVTWIYAPWLGITEGSVLDENFNLVEHDHDKYFGVTNAISLRADVADLFKRNQLGIDVDDNYRVVFFGPPGTAFSSQHELWHHNLDFSDIPLTEWPSASLFRKHFRHCLLVTFLGGDVQKEHEHFSVQQFLEEQGIDNVWEADLSLDVWKSGIGREIIESTWKPEVQVDSQQSDSEDDSQESDSEDDSQESDSKDDSQKSDSEDD